MKKIKIAPVKIPKPTLSESEIKLKYDNEQLIKRLEMLEKRANCKLFKR